MKNGQLSDFNLSGEMDELKKLLMEEEENLI